MVKGESQLRERAFRIRQALADDVVACKKIADKHRHALGFLPKPVFSEAVVRRSLLIAETSSPNGQVVGFVRYNHRKRGTETAIYDICVANTHKQQGVGRALVFAVADDCLQNNRESIILRCPENLPANQFYRQIGFEQLEIEEGRSRRLMVWRLVLEGPFIRRVVKELNLQTRGSRTSRMEFISSATLKRSDWHGLVERWKRVRPKDSERNPFSHLILTPLPGLSERSTVAFVQQHFAGKSCIWFDSGGYFVQQGEIEYEELYRRLLQWYLQNSWADVYVLPDYVPSSDLTAVEVEERVQATMTVAALFSAELPSELRKKALPVVQGHTRRQIRACVETYLDLEYERMGFGSFDTTGKGKDINLLTKRALSNLEFLQELAAHYGFKTHAFGVGSPALIPTLYDLGVTTFDSSCWIRTAGYGNVLLPFLGRRNISHGMLKEVGGRAYRAEEFAELKALTVHDCPFCQSFEQLQQDRLVRAMHNLIVIRDTVSHLQTGVARAPEIQKLIQNSRYYKMRQHQ